MDTRTNGETKRKTPYVAMEMHTTDGMEVDVYTLDVYGSRIPLLKIEDGASNLWMFFETTEQVDRIIDALSKYRESNTVIRANRTR
jgi:hypothetical protein